MSEGSNTRRSDRAAGVAPTLIDRFRSVAEHGAVGMPWAMAAAVLLVLVWAVTGPLFDFSDTWQLVINTGTTIVTFLVVFAIQTSQNRESRALHLKIDELIRATPRARNALMNEEHESEARVKADEEEALRRGRSSRRTAGDPRRRPAASKSTRKTPANLP